jgi:hypothetical protein
MTFSKSNASQRILIDPHFPLEWRDISDFLTEFGPFNGRYIPRYPNDWLTKLQQRTDGVLSPVRMQQMIERIRREIPLCTYPVNWPYEEKHSWSTNVQENLAEHKKYIVVGDALDPTPFCSWEEALEEIRQTRRRSWPFHGSTAEYVDACRALLVNSPSAYLIDPYLDPMSVAGEDLIRSLFDAAKGSRCYSLEVITRRSACGGRHNQGQTSMLDAEVESQLLKIYRNFLPKNRKFRVHLLTEGRKEKGSLRLHDRFFLTAHGSILFGQGFELSSNRTPHMNAMVVDKEHHAQLKQTYINGVAEYSKKYPRIAGIAYPLGVDTFEVANED